MIDLVKFNGVGAQLGYEFGWFKDGAVHAVAEKCTTGFEKVGNLGRHGGGTVRMGLYNLSRKVLANTIASDNGVKAIAQLFGGSHGTSVSNGFGEDGDAARDDVVQAKTQLLIPVDAPAREVNVAALVYEGARFDNMTTLFAIVRWTGMKFQLLATLDSALYLQDGGWSSTAIGGD